MEPTANALPEGGATTERRAAGNYGRGARASGGGVSAGQRRQGARPARKRRAADAEYAEELGDNLLVHGHKVRVGAHTLYYY